MSAGEIYESVTTGGASDFAEVVAVLNRNKPWCLMGGLAVNCLLEPVYTVDIDIVAVAANLEQSGHELEATGFRVERFEPPVNAQRPASKLNVQLTTDARDQGVVANATEQEVPENRVPVPRPEDIVRGKVWAWQDATRRLSKRKKDELGLIRSAKAHPELRRLMRAEIVKQL
jgi:hypothetical protein